jgi:6-phosphogluconolactonase
VTISVFDDPEQVAEAAADAFARRALQAVERAGAFNVALSGGSTPKLLFAFLASGSLRARLAWDKVHFFWGDERSVPPDHPESNFGAARDILLSRLDIPAGNIHRIEAELDDPDEAAARYEADLRRHFRLAEGELPRFDLVFLGMGADGHTASLFPGSEALEERRRLVVPAWVESLKTYRVTLTCPVFNNAACIMFLITGQEKAETLRAVVEQGAEPPHYPAQRIRPHNGETLWYVDKAAGRLLSRSS